MNRYPITAGGLEDLRRELSERLSRTRPAIIRAIAEARAYGDLSENAEYHAAKEQQAMNEARVLELEGIISSAQVVDPTLLRGDRVVFGAFVELYEEETEQTIVYQIVGEVEADISKGWLSNTSPVGRAILGKTIGDVAEVRTPAGIRTFEILGLRFS